MNYVGGSRGSIGRDGRGSKEVWIIKGNEGSKVR